MRTLRSRRQRGFSLIELLIVIAIILVLAAVAIPKLNSQRMMANETAAVQQIKTLHQAQVQYQTQFGRFATTLAELGPPAGGNASPSAANIIPGELATGKKSGYIYALQGTAQSYSLLASPEVYNSTGRRSFFSDDSLVIHESWSNQPATASSPELGSTAK